MALIMQQFKILQLKKANGEYLLLLNNDTQVIDPDFLVSMVGYARRSDVGAVGAKLLYEMIQSSMLVL